MVKLPAVLIWRPLKFATPLEATTVVVPEAKLPDDNATMIESVDPVFPVVMVFPKESSTVTDMETVPPALMGLEGCAVTASLYSAPGPTENELELTADETPEIELGVAVNV